ncbi:MAG: hypothetical protein V1768_00615 [Patescibacteria group bacterium]
MIKMRKIRSNKSLNQKVNKQAGKKKKGCGENEFLLAEAKRRRAETLGGVQSKSACGFSLKKVRISFRVRSQIGCCEFVASPLRLRGSASPPETEKAVFKRICHTLRGKSF